MLFFLEKIKMLISKSGDGMYVYLLNVMVYYKNTYSGMGVNHIT